jgi:hypothetical protein
MLDPVTAAARADAQHLAIDQAPAWSPTWKPLCTRRKQFRGLASTSTWDEPFLDLPSAYVDPALRRRSGREVKYPCYQRIRRARVTLRWRGSTLRTDTAHCPISRY